MKETVAPGGSSWMKREISLELEEDLVKKKWRLVRKSQKDLDKVLTKFLIAGGPSGRAGAGA